MELWSSFDWLSNPVVVIRQFMAGLANGMLLFVVAAGLSLIFGVSRIINFAHGAIFMLGAYIAFTIVSVTGQSLPLLSLRLPVPPSRPFCSVSDSRCFSCAGSTSRSRHSSSC